MRREQYFFFSFLLFSFLAVVIPDLSRFRARQIFPKLLPIKCPRARWMFARVASLHLLIDAM